MYLVFLFRRNENVFSRKANRFAPKTCESTEDSMNIFRQSSKTLLFHNNDSLVKKSADNEYAPWGVVYGSCLRTRWLLHFKSI